MLSEDDAKTKWCAFSRFKFATSSDSPSSNREGGPSAGQNPWLVSGTRCLASACMAWRWGRDAAGDVAYQVTKMPDNPGHTLNAPMGFCGLAGRPE